MRGPRFFLALAVSKGAASIIHLLAPKRGTSFPGRVALKIDPQFIAHIRGVDPEKTILVTGTNGKSTSVNLIHHILSNSGFSVTANLDGANMLSGVATALLHDSTMRGRLKTQAIVMETDERYLRLIRAQLPAKYICITNIQKDQAQRNGEPSVILDKIALALNDNVTLIVNQDDPNALSLEENAGRVVTYAVKENSHSFDKEDDFFAVGMPCPRCHNPVKFDRYNIENIGPFSCPHCGFGSGSADYTAENIDFQKEIFSVRGQQYDFYFHTPYFLYCYMLAIAVLSEAGLSQGQIAKAIQTFRNIRNRLTEKELAGKQIKYIKMKSENPETLQSSLNLTAEDPSEKAVLFGLEENIDLSRPYVFTFILFDCDFRGVVRSGVTSWVSMSKALGRQSAVRLLYDGLEMRKLITTGDGCEQTVRDIVSRMQTDNIYLIDEDPYFKDEKRQ